MPKTRPAARILACLVTIAMVVPATTVAQDDGGDVFQLTLDDALRIALENNLDLVSAYRDPLIAEEAVVIEDTRYDIGFEARGNRSESRAAQTASATETSSSSTTTGSVGIDHQLKYGGNYTFGLGTTLSERAGGLTLLPKGWYTGFDFQYSMPLLKGLGKEVETESLTLARGRTEVSRLDLQATAQPGSGG